MASQTTLKPLWTCPRCRHRFVTADLWHSCGRYRLADHFRGREPIVRKLFDRFVALVRRQGPVTVYAQKTRIVCMVRVRFAGATARKRSLHVGLWLRRRRAHPALRRVEHIPPGEYYHHFKFERLGEFDRAFSGLVREAYAIGCRDGKPGGRV